MKLKTYPKPTDLVISTCTVVSNVSNDIDLNYFSRVVPIHDMYSNTLEEKNGGIYNITLYSDFSRGDTYDKKVKNKEFNNQVTIKYKYWGFRNINMKIFTNGKLQMTGLKTEMWHYLPVDVVQKMTKLAEHYNISRKARGLEKSTKSDKGFVQIWKQVKGNQKALRTIPVKASIPNGETWDKHRNNYCNRRHSMMMNLKIILVD